MHEHKIIQVDEHTTLRQLELKDAELHFDIVTKNKDYLQEFLDWPEATKTVDDSRAFIELSRHKRARGETYSYGIFFDEEFVGHISLMHAKEGERPEIGYWVSKEYSGKGITTRAAIALTKFTFEVLGLESIVIRADVNNLGSNKVAEKTGYSFVGKEEKGERTLNVWCVEK